MRPVVWVTPFLRNAEASASPIHPVGASSFAGLVGQPCAAFRREPFVVGMTGDGEHGILDVRQRVLPEPLGVEPETGQRLGVVALSIIGRDFLVVAVLIQTQPMEGVTAGASVDRQVLAHARALEFGTLLDKVALDALV